MVDFFILLTILIVPIIILLYIRQTKRKKVSFSFLFFKDYEKRTFKQILIKFFQLFYDVIFDIIIALLIAILLSGIFGNFMQSRKNAVVFDGSYSMTNNTQDGSTILEKGIQYYFANKDNFEKHDIYLVAFDINKVKTRLYKINYIKNMQNPAVIYKYLTSKYFFYEYSYEYLEKSKLKNYNKVFFITDFFPYRVGDKSKLSPAEIGQFSADFFYPIGIIDDLLSHKSTIYFIKSPSIQNPEVEIYDKNKKFIKIDEGIDIQNLSNNFFTISTQHKSLLKVKSHLKTFYINLARDPVGLSASGAYSQILFELLNQGLDLAEQKNAFLERGFSFREDQVPFILLIDNLSKDELSDIIANYNNMEYISDRYKQKFIKDAVNPEDILKNNSQIKEINKNPKIILSTYFIDKFNDYLRLNDNSNIDNLPGNENKILAIMDPSLTAGYIIPTIDYSQILYKKLSKDIFYNFLLYEKKFSKKEYFYPLFFPINYLKSPSTIIFYAMMVREISRELENLTEKSSIQAYSFNQLAENETNNFSSDYNYLKAFETNKKYIKLENNIFNKVKPLEINKTSLLYKYGDKFVSINIDIEEFIHYKKDCVFSFLKTENTRLVWLAALMFVYLLKIISYIIFEVRKKKLNYDSPKSKVER
jgi:hypothetical protein